jgi:hypothetical protein
MQSQGLDDHISRDLNGWKQGMLTIRQEKPYPNTNNDCRYSFGKEEPAGEDQHPEASK